MRLSLGTLGQVPAGLQPVVAPKDRRVGIVHIGLGAFHRAHQAFYTEDAGDWGICGVSPRGSTVVERLAAQDGLYTLLVRDGAGVRPRVLGAVREVRAAGSDPGGVVARLADPAVRVVTLTVTEKAYRHDPATGALRLTDPEIAADLASRPPRTVVGLLTAGLAARRRADAGPLTVLCCDNLPHNGRTLARLVAEFTGRADPGLADWLAGCVTFPSSMVDRIVPATAPADLDQARTALGGVADLVPVVAEPFTQWVIEDDFAADRPAWERAGATLTADVTGYETLKLRLFNGIHSTLAYLGALAGHTYIADAVTDPVLGELAHRLGTDDVIPTLTAPDGVDLAAYRDTVLARMGNPELRHRTTQVAMDGTQKLPQRLLGVLRERRATGAVPHLAAFALAAWMRYVSAGTTDTGAPITVDDPLADRIAALLAEAGTGPGTGTASSPAGARAIVSALFSLPQVLGDLAGDDLLRDLLADHLTRLARDGARQATRTVLS